MRPRSTIPWGGKQEEVLRRLAVLRDETTRWTEGAHDWARQRVREQFGFTREHAVGGALWLWLPVAEPKYVAEVRGQAFSGTGDLSDGPQTGMSPARLALLREMSLPIYLVFVQGSGVWAGWLEALPEPRMISRADRAAGWLGRVGWSAGDLGGRVDAERFAFPSSPPAFQLPSGKLFA